MTSTAAGPLAKGTILSQSEEQLVKHFFYLQKVIKSPPLPSFYLFEYLICSFDVWLPPPPRINTNKILNFMIILDPYD